MGPNSALGRGRRPLAACAPLCQRLRPVRSSRVRVRARTCCSGAAPWGSSSAPRLGCQRRRSRSAAAARVRARAAPRSACAMRGRSLTHPLSAARASAHRRAAAAAAVAAAAAPPVDAAPLLRRCRPRRCARRRRWLRRAAAQVCGRAGGGWAVQGAQHLAGPAAERGADAARVSCRRRKQAACAARRGPAPRAPPAAQGRG